MTRVRPVDDLVVTPAGHDRSVWAAAREQAAHPPADEVLRVLTGGRTATLVVVAAHPDDETLGLGRLAFRWAQVAGPVTGVVATAGEACVDHVTPRPGGLAARRMAEWHLALDRLGVTGRHALGLGDGALDNQEPALVRALERLLDGLGSEPVVLAAPWRGDPHPDHRAVGRAVARVAAARSLPTVEYPVWMTFWSDPASLVASGQELLVVHHDQDADQAHRAATAAFVSQLQPLEAGLTAVVPAAMLDHHREQLLLVSPDLAARLTGPRTGRG